MSKTLNRAELIGNLSKDAETRTTQSGISVTSFTVVTSESWKDKTTGEWQERPDFHNCVLWKNENLAQYLKKGTKVWVSGSTHTRSYDDKEGNKKYVTEVKVAEVILCGGRAEGSSVPAIAVPDFEPSNDDFDAPF